MIKSNNIIFFLIIFSFVNCIASNNDTIIIHLSSFKNKEDITDKLQSVLNKPNKKPLKIILSKGKYYISKDILISKKSTALVGEKDAEVYFVNNNGIILQNECIVVEGITFRGNGQSSKEFYSGYAILLNGAKHCIIKNNIFENIAGNNIFFYPRNGRIGSSHNVVCNNQFINPKFNISSNGDEGAIILGYSGTDYEHSYNKIENNIIDGNFTLKIGIGLIGHGNHNIIKKNTIKNVLAYGILLYESKNLGFTLYDNEIVENTILNIGEQGNKFTFKGMGIYVMSALRSVIAENIVTNTLLNSDKSESLGAGAISVSLSPNSIIKDNEVLRSGMYGIVSDYSFNSTLTGNRITEVKKSAMYFINQNDILVKNNHFQNIGETVFKGYFQNTGIGSIRDQIANKKYHNLETGNNIKIENNQIITDNQLLFFTGTTKNQVGLDNKIGNNTFAYNIITRSSAKELEEEDIAFIHTKNKNKIIGNKIIKNKNEK